MPPDAPRPPALRLPGLVAHRGWVSRGPENTLSALRAAVGAGAQTVEIDVQLSSDRRPVLFHDRTLDRLCGVGGAVHERTLAELSRLPCADRGRFGDAFASERIATLDDLVRLLEAHGSVRAFVEIKRIAIERFGADVLLDRVLPILEPVRDRVALISFSIPFLLEARARVDLPLGAVFDAWRELEGTAVEGLAPEYVFCDVDGLPGTGSLDAGRARLVVYEVAEPEVAATLGARGVDLVETFAIGEMLAAFRELEARGE